MGGGESGQVEGEASAAGVTEKKTKRKTKAQKAKEKEVIEGRRRQLATAGGRSVSLLTGASAADIELMGFMTTD